MSKQILLDTLEEIADKKYTWNMYFFRVDNSKNPYAVHKVRFKNRDYLSSYVESLNNMIRKFQVSKIEEVQEYTGENSKVSCDKIALDNELIKDNWDCLVRDVQNSSDRRVGETYNGYIIEGQPINSELTCNSVIMVKIANPIIKLENKKSVVFSFDDNHELISMTDDVCKLYMNVDFMVIDKILYTFNYRFEDMFRIEKTMKKIKQNAISRISDLGAIQDTNVFCEYAKSYKSPRTFITLNEERMERIRNDEMRKKVSNLLEVELNPDGKFVFKSREEAYKLIKYLCFKLFKDGETEELLEANNVTKYNA